MLLYQLTTKRKHFLLQIPIQIATPLSALLLRHSQLVQHKIPPAITVVLIQLIIRLVVLHVDVQRGPFLCLVVRDAAEGEEGSFPMVVGDEI